MAQPLTSLSVTDPRARALRDRFHAAFAANELPVPVLADELGHWICQYLEGTTAPRYCRADDIGLDSTAKAIEREANVLAAELVIPEPEVRETFSMTAALAERFGVSGEAMSWRLYNLGLVDERP
jgi:Zn-dependent peptidase ImmA (M78 family)